MLQQTTVAAVIPFYERFLARWPTVETLAAAPLDDVLAAWAGLGYYSRARNLHACAGIVAEQYAGQFPETEEELRELPGIGPYTAAAIAAIAFGAPATPVDGNIERVIARLFAVRKPLPAAKEEIRRLAATLTPAKRAGDFAQALMDLGASLCTPKRPSCLMCPLQRDCGAHAQGIESTLPVKAAKPERPMRLGLAFLALREDGHVLLRKRPEAGLLGGMLEVPSADWAETMPPVNEALRTAPVRAEWWAVPGTVTHTFTHFRLEFSSRAIVQRFSLHAAARPRGAAHGACAGGLVVGAGRRHPHLHALQARNSSTAPSCQPTSHSPSGPIRSAAAGSPAATSTASNCPASCARSSRMG